MIKNTLMKILSYFIKIPIGYSTSIDSEVRISDDDILKKLNGLDFYNLRQDSGVFELYKIENTKHGRMYTVSHLVSNKSVKMPEWCFELIFEKSVEPVDVRNLLEKIKSN